MVKLEHLDETHQKVADWTSRREWNTTLWTPQNHKIKIFFTWDIVFWFPKGKKKHTRKFKK
jgi:hypothetical protein